jgi:hypothetical protein
MLWGAALLVALAGLLAGPALFHVIEALWSALQPRTVVTGWDVVAVLGGIGAIWLALVVWLLTRFQGRNRWIVGVVCTALAICPAVAMKLEKPGPAETFTLSPADAQTWKAFTP